MSQIVWLSEAIEDIARLRSFLENKNISATKRAAKILQNGISILQSFPEIGFPMKDDTNRRELFLPFGSGGYVLRYRIDKENIVIIRVWHSKENRH